MIILSVDYGDARTGIAVCDKSEILASPVTVIKEWNAQALAEKIAAIAKDSRAEEIIVGLPKNMDGSEGFRAKECTLFGELLQSVSGLPVTMRDERLTTVSAHNYLSMNNVRGQKRKDTVDAVSAVILLEDYMRFRKNTDAK